MNLTKTTLVNPFPGLRPFREDEEHLFFGRENQVDSMVDKLAATRFLAVVGTSGSGKSSLVNSGLCPALRGGLMTSAGTSWKVVRFRPGSDPIRAMARAMSEDGVLFRDYKSEGLTLDEILETTLSMSSRGSVDIYEQSQLEDECNLLIVVDQFEELFRYRQKGSDKQGTFQGVSEEAVAFVNLLLEAKNQTEHPIYVILTMRSDFLGDCAQFIGLAEAINEGQYLVPRMTRDERRAAISGPVGVGGGQISPVLLTRLVNDVGDNPDQLSILQHALNRTWAEWQHGGGGKGLLDLPHYEAIGTMAHALDQHAEKAYAELTTDRQKQICSKIFKALTDKATDPRGTRRPTTLGTLCALADATADEVKAVIDVFRKPSRSFLMPPVGEALEPETVIDISHESLMRVWKRLDAWANEEAASARMFQRLTETAALHAAGQASLWQDPDLQLALDWRDENQPNQVWADQYQPGHDVAMSFLLDSLEERDKTLRAQRLRSIASVAGILAIVLIVVVFFVIIQNNKRAALERTNRLTKAVAKYSQGLFEKEKGNVVDALVLFKEAEKDQKQFYDLNNSDKKLALDYSNSLTQIGSITDGTFSETRDLSTAETSYTLARAIREKLCDPTNGEDPNGVTFNLRLADAVMNIAILEEGKIDFDEAHVKNDLKQFNLVKGYYTEAMEIYEKKIIKLQLGKSEKSETALGLGKCFQNLQGLYQLIYNKTVDDYYAAKEGGDEAETSRLKQEYTSYQADVRKYWQKATETVKALADAEDPEALYITASCNKNLAAVTGDDDTFEEAYLALVELVRKNPGVAKYKDEFEKLIDEVYEDPTLLKKHRMEIASFLYDWGRAADSPIIKQGYFKRATTVLDQILEENSDDAVAKDLHSKVDAETKNVEELNGQK